MTTARLMDEFGRPQDRKPILPGDIFQTSSGRVTSPYPKQKSAKYSSQWLIDNAVAEAEARGDIFNAPIFKRTMLLPKGLLVTADREGMIMYLFGNQPKVVPSILKPLTGNPSLADKAGDDCPDCGCEFVHSLGEDLDVFVCKCRSCGYEWGRSTPHPSAVAMMEQCR
ncbi:hypothetical protein ACYPKM_01945 [Pseudomonas aeruginosa]